MRITIDALVALWTKPNQQTFAAAIAAMNERAPLAGLVWVRYRLSFGLRNKDVEFSAEEYSHIFNNY